VGIGVYSFGYPACPNLDDQRDVLDRAGREIDRRALRIPLSTASYLPKTSRKTVARSSNACSPFPV
jgi:hypothetical protein